MEAHMDWTHYLFSFTGRINRAKYWLFLVITIVVVLVATVVGGAAASIPGAVIAAIFASIILLYPSLAVAAKRLHDRGKSAWWLLVFYVLPAFLSGVSEATTSEGAGLVLSLASAAISIWAIIELGFLRGMSGPNQYGPDPLDGRGHVLV
jgi:uncharacterized membrane protein YhaH (DUF805 family)